MRKNRRTIRHAGHHILYWLLRGSWGGMGVAVLMMAGVNSDKYEDVLSGEGIPFAISSTIYIIIFSIIGIRFLSSRDVKA